MEVNTMYFRIIALIYFCQVGQVCATSYPEKCRALILDPLEQCTNLFSQVKFDQLKDPNSRETRRISKCRKTLKNLYTKLSSLMGSLPKPRSSIAHKPPKPKGDLRPISEKPLETLEDYLAWFNSMQSDNPKARLGSSKSNFIPRLRREVSKPGASPKARPGPSKSGVNQKVLTTKAPTPKHKLRRPTFGVNQKFLTPKAATPKHKLRRSTLSVNQKLLTTTAPTSEHKLLRPTSGVSPKVLATAPKPNYTLRRPTSGVSPKVLATAPKPNYTLRRPTSGVSPKVLATAPKPNYTLLRPTSGVNQKVLTTSRTAGVNSTCKKLIYKGTVVDLMPFSYQMMGAINEMLARCCGDTAVLCASESLSKTSQVNQKVIEESDIVFPVIGKSSADHINQYHFIPIYKAPGAYYFSKGKSKTIISQNIVAACENLWPLLTICLLLALISGFVVWCIETWKNEAEFPRPFHVGMFEGFWWSFISMSTVGYGDKAPKTLAGRIFSMIWILAGITICSMFTASLTTEIAKLSSTPTPLMTGKRIAVLKSRVLDAFIVAKHGGIIKEVAHENISDGIKEMIQMLNNDSITGFTIDTITYHYFVSWKNHNIKGDRVKATFLKSLRNLYRSEVTYDGEQLSYGVLFKEKKDFDFFENYFTNNQLYLETCYYLQMNTRSSDMVKKAFLLDPTGGLFYKMLYYIIGVLVLIMIFGAIYEYRRNQLKKQRVHHHPGDGMIQSNDTSLVEVQEMK